MNQRKLEEFCTFLTKLTPESLDKLELYFDPEVHFKDPFNDVSGIQSLRAILADMFAHLGVVQFEIVGFGCSPLDSGATGAFIEWRLKYTKKNPTVLPGVSSLVFSSEGLIIKYHDYWDSGEHFYEKIAVIRSILGVIKKRVSTHIPGKPQTK